MNRSSGRDTIDQSIGFSSDYDAIAEIVGLVRRCVGVAVTDGCRNPSLGCKGRGIDVAVLQSLSEEAHHFLCKGKVGGGRTRVMMELFPTRLSHYEHCVRLHVALPLLLRIIDVQYYQSFGS